MRKIGIALGGGSVRGVAHIGIIRALRKRPEFLPSIAAGTSAGSIIAALYAADVDQSVLERLPQEFDWFRNVVSFADTVRRITKLQLGGLISNAQLGQQIDEFVGGRTFDELATDLAILAFDIENRQRVIFTSRRVRDRINSKELYRFLPEETEWLPGFPTAIVTDCDSVGTAVRASCAVPGIFMPVQFREMRLVDGGPIDQVPVDVVKAIGADVSIGISLSLAYLPEQMNSTTAILSGMVGILGVQQLRKSLESADIGFEVQGIAGKSLIRPQLDLADIGEQNMNHWLDAWQKESMQRK